MQDFSQPQISSHVAAMSASIAHHRPAERPGDSSRPFQPCQATLGSHTGKRPKIRSRFSPHLRRVYMPIEADLAGAINNDDSPHAAIADQDIRSPAQDKKRLIHAPQQPGSFRQIDPRGGFDQDICVAPHSGSCVARQRRLLLYSTAKALAQLIMQ
jgi:hypothetical protein